MSMAWMSSRVVSLASAATLTLLTAGCAIFSGRPDPNAVELANLAEVVNALKEELRAFAEWEVADDARSKVLDKAEPEDASKLCQASDGKLNSVKVVGAKISLTAKASVSGSLGLGLPQVDQWAFTGPDGSRNVINEQKFDFDVGLLQPEGPQKKTLIERNGSEWQQHPFAVVLYRLQEQIKAIDHRRPCIVFSGEKDQLREMQFTLGFTAVTSIKGGVKVTTILPVGLPLSIGASGGKETTRGQTITLRINVLGPSAAFI